MLYKNDIANLALGRLGVSLSIVDLATENSQQAKIVRRHFRMSLDALLEMHEWNFATKFLPLILQEEDPTPMFKFSYVVPSDALIVREIAREGFFSNRRQYEDEKEKWQQVYSSSGVVIYSNTPDAHAKYTVRISEDIAMPNHFGRALAAQLSMDIAPSLITNNFAKIRDTLNVDARIDISRGIADDLGRQPQMEESLSPFIRARHR
jgi:hypothetical protein